MTTIDIQVTFMDETAVSFCGSEFTLGPEALVIVSSNNFFSIPRERIKYYEGYYQKDSYEEQASPEVVDPKEIPPESYPASEDCYPPKKETQEEVVDRYIEKKLSEDTTLPLFVD